MTIAAFLGRPGRLFAIGLAFVALGHAPSFAASRPATASQSADGQNRRVRIHNQTGWTLTALQAAGAGSGEWADLPPISPPNPPLLNGASALIDVDDGRGACVYDLRARFANGRSLERTDVNVCEIGDFYLTR